MAMRKEQAYKNLHINPIYVESQPGNHMKMYISLYLTLEKGMMV